MSMKKMLAVVAAVSLVAAPAFAANPFSDVPMNHWAYDAVEQLSAKGILEGYPNGTFKGNKSMTRYEIATMVARMMANGGASGADLEKLKALVVEFQPELEALGVKVDGFDARLSKLEKNLGGLRIWGQLRFDYHAWDNQENGGGIKENGFQFNRARLFARKDLSDNVSWEMRWHADKIDRFWVTVKDAFGMKGLTAKIGQFAYDPEGAVGLYKTTTMWDDDAFFFDTSVKGALLEYKAGGLTLTGLVASSKGAGETGVYTANVGDEIYAANLVYKGEKFWASANAYSFSGDVAESAVLKADGTIKHTAAAPGDAYKVYWFGLGLKPLKGLEVKGAYFMEDITALKNGIVDGEDDPKAFRVALELKQSLLKFTSLDVHYMSFDKGFIMHNTPFTQSSATAINNTTSYGMKDDMDLWMARAVQKWTKKFSTFERFGKFDMDNVGDSKEWGVGVSYQYSPNLQFVVDYTDYDGQFKNGAVNPDYDNSLIRFRTYLTF